MIATYGQKIAPDKQSHYYAGAVIGWSAGCITINDNQWKSFAFAVGSGTVIGVGKELIYDKWMKQGTPEVKDALFTVAGSISGYLLVRGVKFIMVGRDKKHRKTGH